MGVDDYGDSRLNLEYAVRDARSVEKFFRGMKGLLFEEVSAESLVDAGADDSDVRRALERIGEKSGDNDLVIVFLAGHGVRNEKDEFYFLCHGGKKKDLSAHAMGWKNFQKALMAMKAKNILLLLDACHSGSLVKAEQEQVTHDELAEGMEGVTVFAACRGNERSCELPGLGGAFTQSLLSGLGGKAPPTGGSRITLFGAERYVSELVPRITDNMQHPVILCRERSSDIPLSVAAPEKKEW